MSDQAPPRKFDFGKFGARFGEAFAAALSSAARSGGELTVSEMIELASRPVKKVCLFCGQEPQDPPGTALGASCKARVRAAGVAAGLHIGDSVKNLTLSDIVDLARAAKEAGLWTPGESQDERGRPKGRPTGQPGSR